SLYDRSISGFGVGNVPPAWSPSSWSGHRLVGICRHRGVALTDPLLRSLYGRRGIPVCTGSTGIRILASGLVSANETSAGRSGVVGMGDATRVVRMVARLRGSA